MKKTLLSIILIAFGITINAQTTYVNINATGANNGTSWADAYTDLHSATYNTTSGEVWVAAGTYKPSRSFTGNIPGSNTQKTFHIVNNIKVYGGFNGTETLLSQRNWKTNITILSGDFGAGSKSYNVVRFNANTNTTELDGFTTEGGSATSATAAEQLGGAIYMTGNSSPIIRNCTFKNNIAQQHGGAIYVLGGSPEFLNCEFTGNSTVLYDGGALYITGATSVNIANCLFNRNIATRNAGSMLINNITTMFVTNCTFVNNQSGMNSGKSIYYTATVGNPVLTVSNCIFYANTPTIGDEIYSNGPIYDVRNCLSPGLGTDYLAAASQTNNLTGVPFFTDYINNDFSLQCKSPAVNTGNASGLTIPSVDLAGNPRTNNTIDMGAFENNTSSIGIEANKTSICQGEAIILRGTCDATGYTWSGGVTNGVAFYPTSTQTYTCTGTSSSTIDSITIEVANITNESLSGPTTVCSGNTATITLANSSAGASYFLRDNASDYIVDGPIAGTGSALNFTTNNLSSTTSFNVIASSNPVVNTIGGVGLDFDGSNDKTTTNYFFPTTSNLSLEAWIYPESSSYSRILTSFSGAINYASDIIFDTYNVSAPGTSLRLVVGTSTTASVPNVLTLNTWNHVAATFNSGVIIFYVNGTSVGTYTVATTTLLTNSTRSLVIGEDFTQGPASEYFNGKMDEIRIWNRTLGQTEIAANMNECLTGPQNQLEVYYKMNEGSGTVINDYSGNGRNGTFVNGTANNHWVASAHSCNEIITTPTNIGKALDFDGTNDVVMTTFKMPTTSAFTVEGWVFPRSTNYDRFVSNYAFPLNGAMIIDSYNATNNGRAVRFNVYGTSNAVFTVGAPSVLTSNAWNHIACTFNNGVMTAYVNGFEVVTGTAPFTSIPQISSSFVFGEDFVPGTAEHLNGKLDEIRIWQKALNQSEIMANMNNCLTGTETDLLAYYNFENGTGTVLSDLTINQNDGLMQNMDAATDWVTGQFSCETNCSLEMTQTHTVNVTPISNAITYTTFSATATQSSASYQWLDCNNSYAVISGETAQSFTPTANGSYAVAVTLNSCTDTSACANFNAVSLKTLGTESFTLFPNPASNNLTIKSQETIEKIEIYNMLGALVQSEITKNFSVEQLPVGMYIIQIKTAKGTGTSRFMKE
ncbi:MAG: LamG-like jellyroll fold domain-containing protein [Bacteroidota bacterium]|nr:LamG-like jellyroll fold domain-containing protein [Bacteroidota bacterium]